ncbi:proline-rich protein PRCC-like isoform X2 [Clytia hemisphaerica]|uniref:proline-rich protein PRCC-like isoform X2 n=1 Tax=Clytia hemisphaerica TaxID=252671 RepID=UPI0034D751CB
MSLVAAYSESESENESDQEQENPNEVKVETAKTTLNIHQADEKPPVEEERTGFEIEDEDDWQTCDSVNTAQTTNLGGESSNEFFSKLPEPAAMESKSTPPIKIEEEEDEFLKKKPSLEDKLFKKEQALLEKELNEKKKHGDKEDSKHFLSKFTKGSGGGGASGKKSKNQKVMISIPTLEDIGADSDSDEESNQPKQEPQKFMASKKSSALFAMLPKPKNSVTVGANKNRVFNREVNRPLVPHTVTKHKPQAKDTSSKSTSINVNPERSVATGNSKVKNDVDSEESEDDDDVSATSFFSFGEKNTTEKNTPMEMKLDEEVDNKNENNTKTENISMEIVNEVTSVKPKERETKIEPKPNKPSSNKKDNSYFATLFKSKTNSQTASVKTKKDISNDNDVRTSCTDSNTKSSIQTSHGITAPYGHSSSDSSVTAPYGGDSSSVTAPYGSSNSAVTAPYGSGNSAVTAPYGSGNSAVTAPYGSHNSISQQHQQMPQNHGYPTNATDNTFFSYSHATSTSSSQPAQASMDFYHQPNEDTPIDQEAMRALQGRKRRRGEEINIIDVNAQDLQVDKDEYLKNLTVESGYKNKAPQDAGISSQQKRKHQITYLAFQAKEREFELRQSWADSRASKQQTQSKYGF